MAKNKPVVIPTWSCFGTHVVAIELHEEVETGEYQVALTFVLDDGEPLPDDTEKHKAVTIFTDLYEPTPKAALRSAAEMICGMFESISATAYVLNGDGEVVSSLDLDAELNEEPQEKEVAKSKSVFFN